MDLWIPLHFSDAYVHQELKDDKLTLKIAKSWSEVCRVRDELEEVVKEILVPTTTEILSCVLREKDGPGYPTTRKTQYTDMELRRQAFRLSEQIKSLHHVWKDGEIVETRVVYKRSVQAKLQLDLERAYH